MSDMDLDLLIDLFKNFIDIYIGIDDSDYSDYLDVLHFIIFVRADEYYLDNFVGYFDD